MYDFVYGSPLPMNAIGIGDDGWSEISWWAKLSDAVEGLALEKIPLWRKLFRDRQLDWSGY